LGQPKGESTPGLGGQIAQRIMPTWSNLGRTDFGAPADPVGALRFPAAGFGHLSIISACWPDWRS